MDHWSLCSSAPGKLPNISAVPGHLFTGGPVKILVARLPGSFSRHQWKSLTNIGPTLDSQSIIQRIQRIQRVPDCTKTARFFVLQKNALQGRYQNKAAVCGSNCHELFCGSFLHLSDRRSEVCWNLWPRVSHAKMITIDADYHSYLLLLSLLVIIYITDMDDYWAAMEKEWTLIFWWCFPSPNTPWTRIHTYIYICFSYVPWSKDWLYTHVGGWQSIHQ